MHKIIQNLINHLCKLYKHHFIFANEFNKKKNEIINEINEQNKEQQKLNRNFKQMADRQYF
ncbi:MAG: type I-C CRISPR-associated protein Cas8c/Csd1 [Rickettsiales bacterium]|jgi:hypothetical protein|nr:type I-C CRISPR-associated protein Cas8c/Csd1 [Rickettsiales bacterium]